MLPSQIFKYCPRCGSVRPEQSHQPAFHCRACNFLYYFNPTCAVAGLVLGQDSTILFLRRAKEPAKGKLAIPGGFIDIGERAEDALRRETREEVNLELGELTFLCTQLNAYDYREVTYPVLDIFFTAKTADPSRVQALDGVDSYFWSDPKTVDPDEIAFPSIREALSAFVASGAGLH